MIHHHHYFDGFDKPAMIVHDHDFQFVRHFVPDLNLDYPIYWDHWEDLEDCEDLIGRELETA